MGSQCLGCFIDDVLKETQRQLATSEEARKKAEANCELYAAEMSEAKAAGWYSAQELFDAYKKLVAELSKLREQKPVGNFVFNELNGYWRQVDKDWALRGNGTPLYTAPVPPADVAELEARFDVEFRRGKELERKLAEQQAQNNFDAARLRALASKCGVAVPESDEELLGVVGVVLGSIRRVVDELYSNQQLLISQAREEQQGGRAMTHEEIDQVIVQEGLAYTEDFGNTHPVVVMYIEKLRKFAERIAAAERE